MNGNLHTQPPAPPASDYYAAIDGCNGNRKPSRTAKSLKANRGKTTMTLRGARPIKVRKLATEGHVVNVGAWQVGHGRLIIAAEVAELAITRLNQAIQRSLDEKPCELKPIIQLMRLKLDFNRQVLAIGTAQIRAAIDSETA